VEDSAITPTLLALKAAFDGGLAPVARRFAEVESLRECSPPFEISYDLYPFLRRFTLS
jgi:hypothetical protein